MSSGRIQWRGVVEAEPFLDGRSHVTIGSRNCRAAIYPMSEQAHQSGRSVIDWVTAPGQQAASGATRYMSSPRQQGTLLCPFSGLEFRLAPVCRSGCRDQEILEYSKDDRDPLPRWSFGRVTLLGDAAHPMRPIGSPAGSQAIVDARVPGVGTRPPPTRSRIGLVAYERRALARSMNTMILRNREFGPSIIMDMAEERAPNGFANIEE